MTPHRQPSEQSQLSDRQRGSIIIALLLILCLSAVVLSSMLVAGVEHELSANTLTETQAFALADSGVEHALYRLRQPKADVDAMLVGGDGTAGTDDDGQLFDTPTIVGDGGYLVQIVDNDDGDGDLMSDSDGIVEIVSTGFSRTSGRRVRAEVIGGTLGGWIPPGGAVTDNLLILKNEASLRGPRGRGFSNTEVQVFDNKVVVDSSLSSAGRLTLQSDMMIAGETLSTRAELAEYERAHSRAAEVDIPDINPADFEAHTDYRFAADGKVYRSDGSLAFDTDGGDISYGNWEFEDGNSPTWRLHDGQAADGGALYFETDVRVDDAGEPGAAINLTIVGEGSVEFKGEAYLNATVPGLLAVAGGDMTASSSQAEFRGSLLVRGQATLENRLTLYGSLIVHGETSDSGDGKSKGKGKDGKSKGKDGKSKGKDGKSKAKDDKSKAKDGKSKAKSGKTGGGGSTIISNHVQIWADGTSIPFPGQPAGGYTVFSWHEEPMGPSTVVYERAKKPSKPGKK